MINKKRLLILFVSAAMLAVAAVSANEAPRISFVEPDVIAVDEGIPESVRKELSAMGHNIRVRSLGNAHGLMIEYDAKGKPFRFTGGADPRGEGAAIGLNTASGIEKAALKK